VRQTAVILSSGCEFSLRSSSRHWSPSYLGESSQVPWDTSWDILPVQNSSWYVSKLFCSGQQGFLFRAEFPCICSFLKQRKRKPLALSADPSTLHALFVFISQIHMPDRTSRKWSKIEQSKMKKKKYHNRKNKSRKWSNSVTYWITVILTITAYLGLWFWYKQDTWIIPWHSI